MKNYQNKTNNIRISIKYKISLILNKNIKKNILTN